MTKLTAIQKETIRFHFSRGLTKCDVSRMYNFS